MFHVGQKVVCVDDSGLPGLPYAAVRGFASDALEITHVATLTRGAQYTIRDIIKKGVRLAEVVNEIGICIYDGVMEPTYKVERFRPVTDISVFTAMLNTKQRELVGDAE